MKLIFKLGGWLFWLMLLTSLIKNAQSLPFFGIFLLLLLLWGLALFLGNEQWRKNYLSNIRRGSMWPIEPGTWSKNKAEEDAAMKERRELGI